MSSTKEANEEFLNLFRSNGGEVTFQKLREFASKANLHYGIGVDLVDIILANRDRGKVDIDHKAKVIRVR